MHHTATPPLLVVAGLMLLAAAAVPAAADRGPLDLEAHRGKVVVVDFWASWCVPCRRSFPWMNAMHEKYAGDGLVIIGVNLDSDAGEAATFLRDYPAGFDIVYDPNGEIAEAFGVVAMPSSYIIDREGNQVTRHLGFKVRNQDEYEALLVETLKR
jgi:thiol-disulfide isomerase/thioredoxin